MILYLLTQSRHGTFTSGLYVFSDKSYSHFFSSTEHSRGILVPVTSGSLVQSGVLSRMSFHSQKKPDGWRMRACVYVEPLIGKPNSIGHIFVSA